MCPFVFQIVSLLLLGNVVICDEGTQINRTKHANGTTPHLARANENNSNNFSVSGTGNPVYRTTYQNQYQSQSSHMPTPSTILQPIQTRVESIPIPKPQLKPPVPPPSPKPKSSQIKLLLLDVNYRETTPGVILYQREGTNTHIFSAYDPYYIKVVVQGYDLLWEADTKPYPIGVIYYESTQPKPTLELVYPESDSGTPTQPPSRKPIVIDTASRITQKPGYSGHMPTMAHRPSPRVTPLIPTHIPTQPLSRLSQPRIYQGIGHPIRPEFGPGQPSTPRATHPYPRPTQSSTTLIDLDLAHQGPTQGYSVSIEGPKTIFTANSPYLFGKIVNGSQLLWQFNNNGYPNKVVYNNVNGENNVDVFFPPIGTRVSSATTAGVSPGMANTDTHNLRFNLSFSAPVVDGQPGQLPTGVTTPSLSDHGQVGHTLTTPVKPESGVHAVNQQDKSVGQVSLGQGQASTGPTKVDGQSTGQVLTPSTKPIQSGQPVFVQKPQDVQPPEFVQPVSEGQPQQVVQQVTQSQPQAIPSPQLHQLRQPVSQPPGHSGTVTEFSYDSDIEGPESVSHLPASTIQKPQPAVPQHSQHSQSVILMSDTEAESDFEDVIVSKTTKPVDQDILMSHNIDGKGTVPPASQPGPISISLDTDAEDEGEDNVQEDDSVKPSPGAKGLDTLEPSDQSRLRAEGSGTANPGSQTSCKLHLFIVDPKNPAKTVELDLSKVKPQIGNKLVTFDIDANDKCIEVKFEDSLVWKFDSQNPNIYPKSVAWHETYFIVCLKFADNYFKLFRRIRSQNKLISIVLRNTKELDKSKIKLLTKSGCCSKDMGPDKYVFRDLGFAFEYAFRDGVQCKELKYNKASVYKYDKNDDNGEYPKFLYLYSERSAHVFYPRTTIFFESSIKFKPPTSVVAGPTNNTAPKSGSVSQTPNNPSQSSRSQTSTSPKVAHQGQQTHQSKPPS